MLKTQLIALAALAAFTFTVAPTLASAEEGTPRVSYAAKKQGRVAFKNKTQQSETIAAQDTGAFNPADIEPAAGDVEPQERAGKKSLADSLRLPRKN